MASLIPPFFYRLAGSLFGLGAPTARQTFRANTGATAFELFDTGDAANIVSGTLAVANGGTNLALYAVGDLIYASGTTTLAKLADVATGSVLVSGGVGVAPAWATHDVAGIVSKTGTQTVSGVKTFDGGPIFKHVTAGQTSITITASDTSNHGVLVIKSGATVRAQMDPNGRFYLDPGNLSISPATVDAAFAMTPRTNSTPGLFIKMHAAQTGYPFVITANSNSDSGRVLAYNAATASLDFLTDTGLLRSAAGLLAFSDQDTTGNPAIGIQAKSTTTNRRDRFRITSAAVDNTDASRKYRAIFDIYDTAARECVRLESDGSTGFVGIGGAIDTASKLAVEGTIAPKSYTVATLPTAGTARRIAYASNGRKAGEGAAAGTGVLVFDDATNWIAVDTGAAVAA